MQLETLLDDIAAWTPTYDTETVAVWNIDEANINLEAMQCPRRILGLVEGDFEFVALGKRGKVDWTVTDTLYIAPTGELSVFRRHYGDRFRFVDSYTTKARDDRGLGNGQAHVVSVNVKFGTFEWPEGSGITYLGARAELEIQEIT